MKILQENGRAANRLSPLVQYLSLIHILGVAQLVARYLGVVEAVGSSPVTQTMRSIIKGSEKVC